MARSTENLKRVIGTRSLALAIVNTTVGSGIFVIPALIAEGLGAAAILAYFLCGAVILLIALCFAELGSKTNTSGGAYTYIETAFGPYAGFVANNIYWLGGAAMSDAAIANALVNTLRYFFPSLDSEVYRFILLFILFAGFCLINIRSVRSGMRFVVFASILKLIPLIVLVIAGAAFVSPENLKWDITPTVSSIGAASLLLFFAFVGLETPLSNGGEIKNPKRTVPSGIFLGVLLILLLYISIQVVTQGVLGDSMSVHKDAPLAAVSSIIFGKHGATLIIIATAVSMMGAMAGKVTAIPRIIFAGARDGLLPKPLAKVHPRFLTPHIAIIFYTALGFVLAVSGGFAQLATLASASLLLIYLGVVLAGIKLRKKNADPGEKTFRLPGGIIISLLAAAGMIWLLSNLTRQEITGITVFIGILTVIYFIMKLVRKKTAVAQDN